MSNEAAQQEAALGFEKCERLLANADVQWFIAESLTKARQVAEEKLRDLATSKDDRENAAHVRKALEDAETFLKRQSDIYARRLPQPKK